MCLCFLLGPLSTTREPPLRVVKTLTSGSKENNSTALILQYAVFFFVSYFVLFFLLSFYVSVNILCLVFRLS